MSTIEVTGVFDYSPLSVTLRADLQTRLERIKQLYCQTVYAAVEIGLELLQVKKALTEDRVYRHWIETEFPWGKSSANQFENVALRFGNVQNLDKFEVSALYVLSAPSTPEAVRSKAIALAESGERISHSRAKALKGGTDILTLEPDKSVVVQNGPYQGQTVTVKSGAPDGLVTVMSPSGEATLLVSELIPQVEPKPAAPTKLQIPSEIEAIATELEIERERTDVLEGILRRICTAARLGQLTDQLLSEAEALVN